VKKNFVVFDESGSNVMKYPEKPGKVSIGTRREGNIDFLPAVVYHRDILKKTRFCPWEREIH
jgi:hypothetical protein